MANYIAICSTAWWNNDADQDRYEAYYTSLYSWATDRTGTLTDDEVVEIQGDDWTSPDTGATNIVGFVTGASYSLTIKTIGLARHRGKWDDTRYILKTTGAGTALTYSAGNNENLVIDGLQIELAYSGSYGVNGIASGNADAASTCTICNNIIQWTGSSTGTLSGIGINARSNNGGIYNNIIIGVAGKTHKGITEGYCTPIIYNNTIINCGTGINSDGYLTNNLCMGCTTPYTGTSSSNAEYNGYDTGSDPGTNGIDLSSYDLGDIFTDPDNADFSLLETATAVRQKGANLTSDSLFAFSTDTAGQTRPSTGDWDLGAWHYSGSPVGDPVTLNVVNAVDGTRIIVLDSDGEVVVEAFEISGTSDELDYEYFEDATLTLKARKSSSDDAVRYEPLTQYQLVTNRGCTFYLSQIPDEVLN